MHGKHQVLSEHKYFPIPSSDCSTPSQAKPCQNIIQDSVTGYLFAPPVGFGLLSALILTFPPGYLRGTLWATPDAMLVPATLGAVEPAVESAGKVFRFETVSGAPGAVFALPGLLSGLIRTLPSVCFLFCSDLLFAAVEYELSLGL